MDRENCYYLAEVIKTGQEKNCEDYCYAKGRHCVSAVCYKELDRWMTAKTSECSISVGFNRPGVIFDCYLMPIASQVRNFMLNRRTRFYFYYDLKTIAV